VAYFVLARPAVGLLLGHGTSGPPATLAARFFRHAEDFALAALLPESSLGLRGRV